MPRRCGGTGALTIGLARPRSGKQAVLPLLTCTNPISGEPPIRGSCSYSVSCPQLTQRMCHPCSWAGNRRIGAPWSAGGGLMFLGSRRAHYLVVDVPQAVPQAVPREAPPPLARRGAEHIAPPCRIVGCCAPAPAHRGLPIWLRFRGRVTTEVRSRRHRRTAATYSDRH